MSFTAEEHLPALSVAWKCPAGKTRLLCSERFQVLWFVSALTQWHGPGRWDARLLLLVKGPLNAESERGKAQQLRWEGNMTPPKWCWVPWVGLRARSCKGKKAAQGKGWCCHTGMRSSLCLPHGKSRGKVSSSAFAERIQVWFHLRGTCARACV